ncbi:ornithine carbamoyltransferase subunit F [Enterobacter cancerogenus]|uniref:Ornithine carbamoyltransferase subunit F n=1 Tax=Enterobacter cancerogenus TaxID=69218 RepID=A0A484Z366_9ENTR|nr:ornithine carbamoyltransferase subunit F [Enterobacter cancerogenus]
MSDLYKKHFLKLLDFTPAQFTSLLTLAAQLKADKKKGKEVQKLTGKNIALIFEKDSTRTRCSFEVAAFDQGARVTYLGPSGSQIGHKESIKDTARVLGRMYDGIQYRGHGQDVVETLAQYAGVPVWNGLTNEFHPTQLLADLLTMQEHLPGKAFNEMTLVYAGDARNNMGNSMLEAAALTGLDLRLVAPESLLAGSEPGGGVQRAGREAWREDHPDGRCGGRREGRGLYLYRRVGVDGRAEREVGGADCAAARLSGECTDDGADRQPGREVPALSARVP